VSDLPPAIAELIEESLALERSGNIGAALRRARETLDKATALDEPEAIAAALTCVAFLQFRTGSYAEAQSLAEQALTHAPPDVPARADALLVLGMCATETHDLTVGEDYYRRAIHLSRQLGYDRALLRGLHNLSAGIYMPRGQFELSLAADAEALRLARDRGMPERAWSPLATMAWVYWLTGQRERAYATLEELSRAVRPGSLGEGYVYCVRASLALDEGSPEKSLPLYARARSIAEAIGSPELNVLVRLGLSRACRATGDAATAYAWAGDALTLASRVGYRHLQGLALVERGRAAWARGDLPAAGADFRSAMMLMAPLGVEFDLARTSLLLAALLHAQKHDEAATVWADAARRITRGGYAFLLEQERALAFPLIATYLNSADPEMAAVCATLLNHLDRVPPLPLRVVTLGRFEVWQGTRRVDRSALRQRRAGELLGLLLVSPGHSLSRDQVVEALRPERAPAVAQTVFHHATSALRRALEPDLPDRFPSRYLDVAEGQATLRLPPGSWVDFEAFKQHVRKGEWAAALALYGGEFLPGELYANWAVAPREELTQLHLRAWLALAGEQLAGGQPQAALDACRRILVREPWHEQAVLLGMRACLELNDRAGALRLYRDLARALAEELGAEPQEELQALYRAIKGSARKKPNP
jgi:DNA-binding SARP family transcriptional activator